MIPTPFRSRSALRVLNVAAVGLALAAITSAVLGGSIGTSHGRTELAVAASTWLIGTLWAVLLRSPKTVTRRGIRIGWMLSPLLAMLNAALACGLLCALGGMGHLQGGFVFGALLGATFGSIVWVPALVGTLIFFGLPIRGAQRLAAKGLAGEERGEAISALACVAISGAALALSAELHGLPGTYLGPVITQWFGVAGLLVGSAAAALAGDRGARRRRFVADAEAGKIEGYRVDTLDEGKVLVRVVAQGEGYRVADFEHEVFELDDRGEAVRPKEIVLESQEKPA